MRPEQGREDGLDEAGQDRVRRLLAAAADPAPMPEQVRSRLDETLAGLVADRAATSSQDEPPEVTDLSRRRARRWPRVLVAAAVVSVVGFGVGNVLRDSSLSGGSDSGAEGADETTALEAPTPADGAAPEAGPPSGNSDSGGSGAPQQNQQELGDGDALSRMALPRVQTESLTADAQRIADMFVPRGESAYLGRDDRCGTAADSPADRVAVRLDGRSATMVIGPPRDGERQVRVYACNPVAARSGGAVQDDTKRLGKQNLLASTSIEP